jgi:putative DNA primase/helicase
LVPELPGILNWALTGLDRLRERGYFLQPKSSKQSIRLLEDLAAPVGAFVKQWCKRGQTATVPVKTLYLAYKDWSGETGHKAESESVFGKSLRDVVHALRTQGRAPNRKYVGTSKNSRFFRPVRI